MILSGSLVRRWPSCQIQWVSMAVTSAGRGGGDVGEHGEGDVEVVVGVRAPREAPLAAELGDADGALHGPEVRVGEGDVDGVQLGGVRELAPVGGDHVGCGGQAGGAAELGHDLAAGEAVLGAAGIFGVGEDVLFVRAEADGFVERPGSVGVEGDAGFGEALGERGDGFDLLCAGEDSAL